MKHSAVVLAAVVALGMGLNGRAEAPMADDEGFVKVESSVLDAVKIEKVRYDADASILTLVFDSGDIVEYHAVPQGVYDELLAAPSKGKFFNENIKGKFEHKKIGGRPSKKSE